MKRRFFFYLLAVVCLTPFALNVLYALQGDAGWSLIQFGLLLQSPRFFIAFWNSVLYTFVILAFNLPTSMLAAYAFSRFSFRGKWPTFWLYILMMLMPFQATMVPQYMTLRWMGVSTTPLAVVLPNMFATFGTFLMSQYMRAFDHSIYEAAELDGVGPFRVFVRLVVPGCRSVIASTAVLSFVNYWSMIEQPSLFLARQNQQPLSTRLGSVAFSGFANAGGIIFAILPMIFYFYNYDALQQGISSLSSQGAALQMSEAKRSGAGTLTGFFLTMLLLTWIAQKSGDVMTPKVTTYDPNKPAPVLSQYAMVVPDLCIDEHDQVFTVETDQFDGVSRQAVARTVTILESRDGFTAIEAFGRGQQVVCSRSRPLRDGDVIEIVGEAFE